MARRGSADDGRREADMRSRFLRMCMILVIVCTAAAARAEERVTNSIGMELIRVKAGTFTYGGKKETPRPNLWQPRFQVKVTLSKDYFLGAFEVTQEEFKKVMSTTPARFKGKKNPVESVTWHEAEEVCRKLSAFPAEKKAGRVYSMPSSAEWEYACRSGSDDIFPWGDEDETKLGGYAWCRDWHGTRAESPHPVGRKKANAWGFHDMLGNVWEWCSDNTWVYPLQACTYHYLPDGWTDPAYPANPDQKKHIMVIRGGGWKSDFRSANCFMVTGQKPLRREDDTGFRVKYMTERLLPAW